MMQVTKSSDRFHTRIGWLDSWHSFSFGEHYHPQRLGFRNLRVINDDRVTAGAGFGTHGHKDMEIVSYVVDGILGHKDSMGTNGSIVPGDIQRMSAGTGVQHSEMNLGKSSPVHFLQIWLLPRANGTAPGYAQKSFSADSKHNVLVKLASGDGARDAEHDDGSVGIGADVDLYATVLDEGATVGTPLRRSRHGWVQVVTGAVRVNGTLLSTGDGAALSDEDRVDVVGAAPASEVLVFDLA
jgi:redox-sensitive bicupin YhaK (pirin superfamily)